jgi:methionyl-tRNA synthetase
MDRAAAVINICLQISANLCVIAAPFLPNTCAAIAGMLQFDPEGWDTAGNPDLLKDGHSIGEASLLFQRIEDGQIESQLEKLKASAIANQPKKSPHMPQKPSIAFDDFMKIDIRTATILEATRVPKTDKLLELKLDTGVDQRTVVSGIAEFYDPADLPGRQVSVLLNLEPRKIRGIMSQGMILMAEDAEGKLTFVKPEDEMGNGSTIR